MAYLTTSATLLLVHRPPPNNTTSEEGKLFLLSIDVELASSPEDFNPSVPLGVGAGNTDLQLVASLPEQNAYPCTLCALFSRLAEIAFIVDGGFYQNANLYLLCFIFFLFFSSFGPLCESGGI